MLALLLTCACATPPEGGEAVPAPPAPAEGAASVLGEQAAEILRRAIRIVTVNPPGDEKPLAEYFVALLREAGIESVLIETPAGESAVGRAAAWGRVPGTRSGAPVVLLSHLDVVPAGDSGWTSDPFAGERVDGFVMGRGAIDAKGAAVVHLLTLIELKRRGVELDRDIIFLATPDEESGGLLGAGTLVRERRDLLLGAGYLLTEGGSVQVTDDPARPIWSVAVTEKNPCWLRVVASGTPGHSAVPPRDAAVPRLIAALDRLQRIRMPVRVVPPAAAMFAAMAELAAEQDRAGYHDLGLALETDLAFRSRFLENRQYAALVRDTLTTTVLEGSSRTNVLPSSAMAHIDARLLPGNSCANFADQIRNVLADPGISVETLLSFPSAISSADSPLFRAIEGVAAAGDPGAVVVPRMIAGFTDAHYFRNIGITAYGFVPRWHHTEEPRGIHGPDERISIENLERGVATMIAILQELDRIEAVE
jgi:acetylornithine deacetylase/succinyl-diaminopimelate desuccinylase-like protein